MLLETYTTLPAEELKSRLPDFLTLGEEVTGDSAFSMYNLALKGEWANNRRFCHIDHDEHESTSKHQKGKLYRCIKIWHRFKSFILKSPKMARCTSNAIISYSNM